MRLAGISVATLASLVISGSVSAQYGDSSDCSEARNTAESAAYDLASYSKRLQRCAENGDYSDDCYTEFRRVRSSHNDYQSAISQVSSYCD